MKSSLYKNLAVEIATTSSHRHSKHGAVLVDGNRVISNSSNSERTRINGETMSSTHSEVGATYKLNSNSFKISKVKKYCLLRV